MLILPMKIKGVTANLQVSFKQVGTEKDFLLSHSNPLYLGEFQVNKEVYFGEGISHESRKKMEKYLKLHPELLTDFVRKSLNTKSDPIWVYSRNYKEKDFCTRYRVPLPPKRGNVALDKIYGKLLNDLRLNVEEKTYDSFLSFQGIGLNDDFAKDRERAVREGVEVLDYFQQLDFQVINDWGNKIVNHALSIRPKKFLEIYQEMANQNTKMYMKIYRFHQQVYDTNLSWPKFTEAQKVYIKTMSSKNTGTGTRKAA